MRKNVCSVKNICSVFHMMHVSSSCETVVGRNYEEQNFFEGSLACLLLHILSCIVMLMRMKIMKYALKMMFLMKILITMDYVGDDLTIR